MTDVENSTKKEADDIKSGGYFSIYLLGVKRGSCMLVARGSLCKLSLQC